MSKVIAVIGSGFGDEGKGLMTDYFSSQENNAVVIRSNGGAQAGHTVVTPEGNRHAFSHFGSGTFTGTPTFLSSFFVSNPILFEKEHKEFVQKFNIKPKIYVDPNSPVTIPYDMLINQTLEALRGDNQHGSCGVGFGETLERGLMGYGLAMQDIITLSQEGNLVEELTPYLHEIRKEYVPTRVEDNTPKEFTEIINNDDVLVTFFNACKYMLDNVTITTAERFSTYTLIFEGAQGLLLDMDYGFFPHVTRSNCGMKNVTAILNTIPGEHTVAVYYVTRAYVTRHGAGPLVAENNIPAYNIVDKTNIPNEFQGKMRFAPFNVDMYNSITAKDFLNYAPRGARKLSAITCIDQLSQQVKLIQNDRLVEYSKSDFHAAIKREKDRYLSYGPTRDDVKRNK